MTSNKRMRFQARAYVTRVHWLAEEMEAWQQVYELRGRNIESPVMAAGLLARALVADRAVHKLREVEDLIWDLVQTTIAPPPSGAARADDSGSRREHDGLKLGGNHQVDAGSS